MTTISQAIEDLAAVVSSSPGGAVAVNKHSLPVNVNAQVQFDMSVLEAKIHEGLLTEDLRAKINSFCMYSKLLGYCQRCAHRLYKEVYPDKCPTERLFELPELVYDGGEKND